MVHKELTSLIKIKKGASIKDYLIVMMLFVVGFTVVYNYIFANVSQAGIAMDSDFNRSYQRYLATQGNITELTQDLRDSADDVQEAGGTEVAFFGLNGILGLMKTSLGAIPVLSDLMANVQESLSFIPIEISNALIAMGAFLLVMTIIAFLTQRGREP